MYIKKVCLVAVTLLVFIILASAQTTTSGISGTVKTVDGLALEGATITATHEPTGTVYTGQARAGGRF